MSTKIYNAYKFNGTIQELISFLQKTKKAYNSYRLNQLISGFTDKTTSETIDKLVECLRNAIREPYNNAFSFEASCVVYFADGIHVQFFNLPDEFAFLDDRFQDYHYQNSTDPWYMYENWQRQQRGEPELSIEEYNKFEQDWKDREDFWMNKIFSCHSVPSDVGLTFYFFNEYSINNLLWDLKARNFYFQKKYKIQTLQEGTQEFKDFLMSFKIGQIDNEWICDMWVKNLVDALKVYENIGFDNFIKLLSDGKIAKI